jgi:hypothetical protein
MLRWQLKTENMSKKIPKNINNPSTEKKVSVAQNPENYKKSKISWHIGRADFDGEFGWQKILHKRLFIVKGNILSNFGIIIKDDFLHFASLKDLLSFLSSKKINQEDALKIVENLETAASLEVMKVYEHLRDFEKLTWQEIETAQTKRGHTRHHNIPVSDLSKAALKRLKELKLDDLDEIFSLRLEGDNRIFGIREFNTLIVLWYDEHHQVCP